MRVFIVSDLEGVSGVTKPGQTKGGSPNDLRHRPGVERVSDRTIVSRADTWWDAWRQFFF